MCMHEGTPLMCRDAKHVQAAAGSESDIAMSSDGMETDDEDEQGAGSFIVSDSEPAGRDATPGEDALCCLTQIDTPVMPDIPPMHDRLYVFVLISYDCTGRAFLGLITELSPCLK